MYIETFLDYLKYEKRYSPHTIRSYQNDLEAFFRFCKENKLNFHYKTEDHKIIRKWIVNLMEAKMSARSVNRKISSLQSYFKFLLKENKIAQNPMSKIQSPKSEKRLPVFVEETRMTQMFDELEWADDFKGLRDRLIIELFYLSGIRLSELVDLKTTDIDFHQSQFKVLGKRNKERIIPFTSELSNLFSLYLSERQKFGITHHYLFLTEKGEKIYPKLVYRTVHKYLSLVSTQKKKSPHVLRHTFATHMLNKGADLNAIKELLGHSNLAATQVYTHNTFEKLKRIYEQAHPRS